MDHKEMECGTEDWTGLNWLRRGRVENILMKLVVMEMFSVGNTGTKLAECQHF
jgi:hypothetical protein